MTAARPLPRAALRTALCAALLAPLPAIAQQVALPFATPAARTTPRAAQCPKPPEPSRNLEVVQPYSRGDGSYSRVDPARMTARNEALQHVREFTAGLARHANAYTASDGKQAVRGACALMWLESWARAGALTQLPDHDAEFVLSINLSGWALSYMQVRDLRLSGNDPHPAILQWFRTLSNNLQRHTDGLSNNTARNNHRYWAGLAAMGVAVNTNDPNRMRWAVESARVGLDQISPEGSLPLEVARGSRARHYHLYSASALVMSAELARAGGYDLYGYRSGALHRLVRFSTDSLVTPGPLVQMAGSAQLSIGNPPSYADKQVIAWTEFYQRRFPGRAPAIARLFGNRPLVNPELGGNLTMLAGPRPAAR